jgi:hypothetical protein
MPHHLFALQAISSARPDWIQELLNSYVTDTQAQQLLQQLAIKSPDAHGYSLDKGIIKVNDKLWVANTSALRTKIIHSLHSTALGGHSGVQATFHRVKGLFHWRGLRQDVEDFVKQCTVCQHAKHSNAAPSGLLQPLPIPTGVW